MPTMKLTSNIDQPIPHNNNHRFIHRLIDWSIDRFGIQLQQAYRPNQGGSNGGMGHGATAPVSGLPPPTGPPNEVFGECVTRHLGWQVAVLWQSDRATRLSVEILQLQNIHIVLHYLRDSTFSRFYTIPECDRHTHTQRRTDRYTTMACTALV